MLATPANDTFAFLVDLASYPSLVCGSKQLYSVLKLTHNLQVFGLFTSCGVWILRRRRFELGLPAHSYRAWNFVILAYVVKSLALLVMPWYVTLQLTLTGSDLYFREPGFRPRADLTEATSTFSTQPIVSSQ